MDEKEVELRKAVREAGKRMEARGDTKGAKDAADFLAAGARKDREKRAQKAEEKRKK